MPTCKECSVAIATLAPRHEQDTLDSPKFNARLPQLQPTTPEECWICARFVDWLKAQRADSLESWCRGPLSVEYSLPFRVRVPRPGHAVSFLFGLNICIEGQDNENESCEINLDLVPAEGIHIY